MKPLSRTLGILSLASAMIAVAIPAVGAIVLLRTGSPAVIGRAAPLGLAVAIVGFACALAGYLVARRVGTTAWPIIGGLAAAMVAFGFAVAPLFV